MYCLKCRKFTDTINEHETTTKNNRRMLKGKCKICGTTKNKFIKGGNLADTIIDKMPEMHLPYHNYTGPFTKLNKKLDEDDKPRKGFEPFNQVDAISLKHDICYRDTPKFKDKNRICDKNMLEDLAKLKPKSMRELIDKKITQGVIKLKHVSGLGNKN